MLLRVEREAGVSFGGAGGQNGISGYLDQEIRGGLRAVGPPQGVGCVG